jgi:putative transposase
VCFASKNLYNKANYNIRQSLIFCGEFSNYNLLDKALKSTPEYRALPAKVAQQTLLNLQQNWSSFFAGIKEYKLQPEKLHQVRVIPKNNYYIIEVIYEKEEVKTKEKTDKIAAID